MTKTAFLIALIALIFSCPALAKEKNLGRFGGWDTFADNQGGQNVCYMVTTKIVKSTGPAKRAIPYLMITHRPVEGSTDTVSYGAGTLLNTRHDVKLTLAKNTFDLFSVRDISWARDAQTDHKIAAAIRANASATAKAVPAQRGAKPISDTFDLTGAGPAYHAIGKACGLISDAPKKAAPKKPAAKAH